MELARRAMIEAPQAERIPHEVLSELTGDARSDDYYWLRDDKRRDGAVLRHLEAENAYTRAALADTDPLQERLFWEMRGRIQEADQSAAIRRGRYMYYSRTVEGKQYRVHCRRKVPASQMTRPAKVYDVMEDWVALVGEEVLLDENREARGQPFYMTSRVLVSPDHGKLAYAVDTVGGEKFTLHVRDLATGRACSRPIPGTAGGSLAWGSDNETLFYCTKDELDRPDKVWRHEVGTDPSKDVCVYHETDGQYYLGVCRSHSGSHVLITAGSAITSETRVVDAARPRDPFEVVLPRVNGVEYDVAPRGDQLFITIRDDTRFNSELLVSPREDPSNTRVLLGHRGDVKLEGVELKQHHLITLERIEGLQVATVYDLPEEGPVTSLGTGRVVKFDEPSYELQLGSRGDFDDRVARLDYTSLKTPSSDIDVDLDSMRQVVKKVQPVRGGYDPADYETLRVWARAPDGTRVPISVVRRRTHGAGPAPMLLDAYGSYEIANDPYFSAQRLSLLERGVSFAIAHVRGGGEMGRRWYEDGKFLKKKNTFTDLIACAEHLIAEGFTSPRQLCISGRSAGGLTMGAVTNMRPDLFQGVIMGVPFVDVLTTMMDPSIPLTEIEWEEWGNPLVSREYYDYMKSYSPVDNVARQAYPNILVTAGLHDPRVGYWEPAKLVAKLRRLKTDQNLLLAKFDMGAGHFSKSGRFDKLRETALEYAFLLKVLGLRDRDPSK